MDTSNWISSVIGGVGLVAAFVSVGISIAAHRTSKRATAASEASAKAAATSATAAREAMDLQRQMWQDQNTAEVVLNVQREGGSISFSSTTNRIVSLSDVGVFRLDIANRGQHPAHDVTISIVQQEGLRPVVSQALPGSLISPKWIPVQLRVLNSDPVLANLPHKCLLRITYVDGRFEHVLEWPFRLEGLWPDVNAKLVSTLPHRQYWDEIDGHPVLVDV